MKTYYLLHAALALIIIGCSNSNDVSNENFEEEESVTANYTLLLEEDGLLTAQLLNADADKLSINAETSDFISVTKPTLTFEEGQVLSMFHRNGDCSAEITVHNFETSVSKTYSVFSAMETCSFTEKAIAYTANTLFIAYEVEITSSISEYSIRIVDISKSEPTWVDVPLLLKPVELAIANNRLFILTIDEELTGEHGISILNLATSSIIHEMLIGFDAHRIFRNPDGNIIISYEELHTTLNSSTLAVQYTNYGDETAPNFTNSKSMHFDSAGKMYYEMPSGVHSNYPVISAVYDFDANTAVLYAYENFLTETQRNFEFEIEQTTMVSYDEENNLLIIGYKKIGGNDKGGLIRIKPAPEPKFVNNLNLEGVPYALYMK